MIVTKANKFRIRVAESQAELRTPQATVNAYYTGDERTAIQSAVKDIEALGEGACFLVEKWYSDSYGYDSYKSGEFKGGRYYPRQNF